MKTALVIPTLDGGETFKKALYGLLAQSMLPDTMLIIDSGSDDDTLDAAIAAGWKIYRIKKEDFNHGATRNLARSLVEADIYIFMTQDAIPADHYTLEKLVEPILNYPEVGLTYGRQIAHEKAGPIESFSRLFSYPPESKMKSKADSKQIGLKTVLCSNSCAAYRREAFDFVGGFPTKVIMCEDVYIAAKMLQAGYSIYYTADALIYHSHNYSVVQEFKRYFDLGVFYESRERWIIHAFGGPGNQGFNMFLSGLRNICNRCSIFLCSEWIMRTLIKIMAYNLGANEKYLPMALKRCFSMHNIFWKLEESER
jgi:rhamnosyltransferase